MKVSSIAVSLFLLLALLGIDGCNFRMTPSPQEELESYLNDCVLQAQENDAAIAELVEEISQGQRVTDRLYSATTALIPALDGQLRHLRSHRPKSSRALGQTHDLKVKAFEKYLEGTMRLQQALDEPSLRREHIAAFTVLWNDGANLDWQYLKALRAAVPVIGGTMPAGYWAERGDNPPPFADWLTR